MRHSLVTRRVTLQQSVRTMQSEPWVDWMRGGVILLVVAYTTAGSSKEKGFISTKGSRTTYLLFGGLIERYRLALYYVYLNSAILVVPNFPISWLNPKGVPSEITRTASILQTITHQSPFIVCIWPGFKLRIISPGGLQLIISQRIIPFSSLVQIWISYHRLNCHQPGAS